VIKSSLEAGVTAPAEADLVKAVTALGVSRQEVYPVSVEDLKTKASLKKCERSWKYFAGEGDITPRDAAAVTAFDAG